MGQNIRQAIIWTNGETVNLCIYESPGLHGLPFKQYAMHGISYKAQIDACYMLRNRFNAIRHRIWRYQNDIAVKVVVN